MRLNAVDYVDFRRVFVDFVRGESMDRIDAVNCALMVPLLDLSRPSVQDLRIDCFNDNFCCIPLFERGGEGEVSTAGSSGDGGGRPCSLGDELGRAFFRVLDFSYFNGSCMRD
jgi:hypothetical protein